MNKTSNEIELKGQQLVDYIMGRWNYLQELVENIVFDNYAQPKNGLMEDYARAFLNEVNYHEILEHILDEKEIQKQIENE